MKLILDIKLLTNKDMKKFQIYCQSGLVLNCSDKNISVSINRMLIQYTNWKTPATSNKAHWRN